MPQTGKRNLSPEIIESEALEAPSPHMPSARRLELKSKASPAVGQKHSTTSTLACFSCPGTLALRETALLAGRAAKPIPSGYKKSSNSCKRLELIASRSLQYVALGVPAIGFGTHVADS